PEVKMSASPSRTLIVSFLFAFAAPALAEDTCGLKGVLGGKPVTLKHCDVALYDGEHSVTLWFTETPITPKEREASREYSNPSEKDASGRTRTSVRLAFCPGGGPETADPKAVKSIEMAVDVAGSPLSGRQWVFELPKDKDVAKIEKLSGPLKLGGR